jgi:hypothetical protein
VLELLGHGSCVAAGGALSLTHGQGFSAALHMVVQACRRLGFEMLQAALLAQAWQAAQRARAAQSFQPAERETAGTRRAVSRRPHML